MDEPADVVEDILAREFPAREAASVTHPARGNHKQTAIVTFGNDHSVVVQLTPDTDGIRVETVLSEAIRERTGVPVPEVFATGRFDGLGYAVVEHATGSDLHEQFVELDPPAQRHVAHTFGRSLAELHETFSFESYGEIGLDSSQTDAASMHANGETEWGPWFKSYARAGIDALPSAFDDVRPELTAALEESVLPESPPSTLFPWDFRPGNALLADGEVSAILDWGAPLAAAPGLSVAKAEHLVADWYVADGTPLRAAFKSGYESVGSYPDIPPAYRLAAIARSAVDSSGIVTRPRYPEVTGDDAVAFHVERFESVL
ncbi:phosphotransferase family protein [Haloferax namakaokahaiae]|uniref:Phosphotransferase family protein n=1 Tax=Haloferax namakaokahaiae TaxID=1748331 RepID=A0ABD5ZFA4_9EURY